MVYRQSPDEVRHNQHPLRFPPGEIARIVESAAVCCTHFDAFRFYSDAARPLNVVQPTRATQVDLEQPGCLHANMDLYKHAVSMAPLVGSSLVRRAFALARDIRQVDMQAAPYDLTSLGVVPLRVETPAGRDRSVMPQEKRWRPPSGRSGECATG